MTYQVTVSGRTYPVSKTLKDQGLKWNPTDKLWFGAVGDAGIDFLKSLPGVRVAVGPAGAYPDTVERSAPAPKPAAPAPAPAVDPEVTAAEDEVAKARALSAALSPSPEPASDPEAILAAPAGGFDKAEALALLAQVKADLVAAARKFKALEALIGG